MRVAWAVAGKELKQRFRDRSAIFMAFVAPTMLAVIVTFAFGSGFGDSGPLDLVVVVADEDDSQLSRTFTKDVLGSRQIREFVTTRVVDRAAAARRRVSDEHVHAAYVIPEGFEQRVAAGARAEIRVITNAEDPVIGDVASAIADAFTGQVNATRLAVFTTLRASGGGSQDAGALAAAAARDRIPVQVDDADVATREVSGANYFGPSMAIFFLFFTVGAGARSLLAERQQGTLPRILAAPARRGNVIVGKAVAVFVLGLATMAVMYLTMGVFFGVHWGDPLAIALLTVFTVVALMSVTALVQTLAKTEAAAGAYGGMVGTGLSLLGGNFFPLFLMPQLVQQLSALTPNGWALRGFTDVAYDGATAADLLPNLAAIGAFIAICGTAAAIRARRITVA